MDIGADPLHPSARALRVALSRRGVDDRPRLPADRAADRSRGRRDHRRELGHVLPPAGTGRRASGAGPAWSLPATASRSASPQVEEMIGVAPVPMEVMGRNGELALAGAAALGWEHGPLRAERAWLPRRMPVRDRLPEQRQGRRPPERASRGLRAGGGDRDPAARLEGPDGEEAGRPASAPSDPTGARSSCARREWSSRPARSRRRRSSAAAGWASTPGSGAASRSIRRSACRQVRRARRRLARRASERGSRRSFTPSAGS